MGKDAKEERKKLQETAPSQIFMLGMLYGVLLTGLVVFTIMLIDQRLNMKAWRAETKAKMDARRNELRVEISEIRARLYAFDTDRGDAKYDVARVMARLPYIESRIAGLESQVSSQRGADKKAQIAANGDLRREYKALWERVAVLAARAETA